MGHGLPPRLDPAGPLDHGGGGDTVQGVGHPSHSEPGPQVKQSVLSAFEKAQGRSNSRRRAVPLWQRSVPLYLAAASLVLFMALSFYAGRKTSRPGGESPALNELRQEGEAAIEITWSVTERDLC